MGIAVEEPAGERWTAGVDLIQSGEGGVELPGVVITRWTAGLDPDPRVQVLIGSRFHPPFHTAVSAREDVEHGLRQLALARQDDRLAAVISEYGLVIELVSDIGERGTTVRLATVAEDGTLAWDERLRPSQ